MDWKQTLSTLKPFSMFIAHYKVKKKERKATCSKTTTTKLEQVRGPRHSRVYSQKCECVSAGAGHELISGV